MAAPPSPNRRGSATVPARMARSTIRDVAIRAGVSTATVSRVLAGIGSPRPQTTEAVMSAVAELDYRPSGVARSLRMRRTRTFGLIVTDIQNPFFPELVQAADVAARALGYSILLGSAAYDENRAMHYLDLMVDRRVDGMIIASSQLSKASWSWLSRSPVPDRHRQRRDTRRDVQPRHQRQRRWIAAGDAPSHRPRPSHHRVHPRCGHVLRRRSPPGRLP